MDRFGQFKSIISTCDRWILVLIACIPLCGCISDDHFAPVSAAKSNQPIKRVSTHVVAPKETLYAIAWRYDLDYRELAQINGIAEPYTLSIGQVLQVKANGVKRPMVALKSPGKSITKLSGIKKAKQLSKRTRKPALPKRVARWQWPLKGTIVAQFSPKKRQKGIDISGSAGQFVYPAAEGIVAYSGHGIPGYGNLLIIKHSHDMLTAYAYNKKLLVKEGEWVKLGKAIAVIGRSHRMRPVLHFEVRKAGKARNPLRYLPKHKG